MAKTLSPASAPKGTHNFLLKICSARTAALRKAFRSTFHRRVFVLPLCAFILIIPHALSAAIVTFDPQERDVGIGSPFAVGVDIDAREAVNVISLSLVFSPGLEPVDVSDGNSIVSIWIDNPLFDQRIRTLSFSGMIPGGYSGTKGRILTLKVVASREGAGTISVGGSSRAYLSGPDSIGDPLGSRSLVLNISSARQNISNILPDTAPPEVFTPAIVAMPSPGRSVPGSERWELVFAAQDKGSGIDHYEVREVGLLPWLSAWHAAESPYLLADQTLDGRIMVRAYDKNGNTREASLEPERNAPMMRMVSFSIVLFAAVILIMSLGAARLKRKP